MAGVLQTPPLGPTAYRQIRHPTRHRWLYFAIVGLTFGAYISLVQPRLPHRDPTHRYSRRSGYAARSIEDSQDDDSRGVLLRIPYAEWYEATPPSLRPVFLLFLALVMALLFCSISITASDFFCPNLASMAAYLGLSETTAGVTLLAFGNGSPDVFSTFVAVRQGTLSLAVGELIGAASFITSVVVGSIAMVQPFKVLRFPFLRDILFFTMAVLLLVWVLADGHLTLSESGSMVIVYVAYVIVVVTSSWWLNKRQKQREFAELGWKPVDEQRTSLARDTHNHHLPLYTADHSPLAPSGGDRTSRPASPGLSVSPTRPTRPRGLSSASTQRDGSSRGDLSRAHFSLLGAVEFRDVVHALRDQSPSLSRRSSAQGSPYLAPTLPDGIPDAAIPSLTGSRHARRASTQSAHLSDAVSRRAGRQRSGSLQPHPAAPPTPRRTVSSGTTRPNLGSPSLETSSRTSISGRVPPLHSVPGSPPVDQGLSAEAMHLEPLAGGPDSRFESFAPSEDEGPKSPKARPGPLNIVIPSNDMLTPSRAERRLSVEESATPSISVVDPSGHRAEAPSEPDHSGSEPGHSDESNSVVHAFVHTLFPSLMSFRDKSLLGKSLAILSVPAIFFLTITLPVIDDGRSDEGEIALPTDPIEGEQLVDDASSFTSEDPPVRPEIAEELHHLVETGALTPLRSHHHGHDLHSPVHFHRSSTARTAVPIILGNSYAGSNDGLDAGDDVSILSAMSDCDMPRFSKVLTATQCALGPMACVYLLFLEDDRLGWLILGAGLIGAVAAAVTLMYATDGTSQPWRVVRCCCGFACSMIWIGSIADEVVNVLTTVGEIFGLSDAIIGLTVFAVGNSLADLVADVTIAQFAPNMAYAACFGGPMLNLLLGIGGAGSWSIITSESRAPVLIHFSATLWVSCLGLILILLATAVVVPLNKFSIDRRWAVCLFVAYTAIMTINVIVEVRSGRK